MDGVNMVPRRAYHHGDLKEALKAEALSLLDEAGTEAVTIREVARRAGVAHSAPANHFKDRRALLTALAVIVTQDVIGHLGAALRTQGTQRARFKAAMAALLSYALANRHRYFLINRHDVLDLGDRALKEAHQEVFDLIAAAVEPSRRASYGTQTYVIAFWSMVHGYVSLRLEGTLTTGRDEITDAPREAALVDLLFDAIE
jgi:AcrR family transcriptional regulator